MAVQQVLIPERRNKVGEIWDRISSIASIWQGGKNIGAMGSDIKGWFGGAAGSSGGSSGGGTTTGVLAAPAGSTSGMPAGETVVAESGSAPAAEGAGAAGGEYALGALAVPAAAGGIAAYDWYKNRKDSNYGYNNVGIKPIAMDQGGYGFDAISRKMDAKAVKDIDFDATKNMIASLNIDPETKQSMLSKVGKAADLTKKLTVKIG